MEFEKLQKYLIGKRFKFSDKNINGSIVDIEFEIISVKENYFKIYKEYVPKNTLETKIKLIGTGKWKFKSWKEKEEREFSDFTRVLYYDTIYHLLNQYYPYINIWLIIVNINGYVYEYHTQ